MISVEDVSTLLKNCGDMTEVSEEQILSCSSDGLNWVIKRLRETADENDPLIAETAAAIARFYFFIRQLTQLDRYDGLKVGDLTVKRDTRHQYEVEKELRKQAIANAASILKDGGFYFCGK